MARYKTIDQFSRESGYTERAIRAKIADGTWLENRVWRRAPDGRILIDEQGYELWVETGLVSGPSRKAAAKSPSRFAAPVAASGSKSPKPLQI